MPRQRVLSRIQIDACHCGCSGANKAAWNRYGRQQYVGALNRARGVVVIFFRQGTAQGGDASAQHVHGVGGRGQLFQHREHVSRQAAQAGQLLLVGRQLRSIGQLAAKQQPGYFFKLAVGRPGRRYRNRDSAGRCQCALRCTERGVAGRRSRKRYRFLGLKRCLLRVDRGVHFDGFLCSSVLLAANS